MGDCSVMKPEHKHCSMIGFGHHWPAGGVQSSVTRFRFEDNKAVEICDEWYYITHYLKSMVNHMEESLSSIGISAVDDVDGLNWCRPYHYTADDIVDVRCVRLVENSYLWNSGYNVEFSESPAEQMQNNYDKANNAVGEVSTQSFMDQCQQPSFSNTESNIDKFLASSTRYAYGLDAFHNDTCFSRDLLQRIPAELMPYVDAKTFSAELLTRLDELHNSYILRCDESISRHFVLDSSGFLFFDSSEEPRLLSSGTSSDLTSGGSGDEQKLPNGDQLRAVQDNLAYNVCLTFRSALSSLSFIRHKIIQ